MHHAVAGSFYVKFSFKWLIFNEAYVTSDDYCPCRLVPSCQDDNVNVVDCLLQNEANIVDLQDKDGDTALHFACNSDHASLEILSCLIENGANINACTDFKITPLMMAVKNCHKHVVSFLIEHGANVDLQDEDGDTALHYITYQESRVDKTETFLTLSTAGASCLCKNSKGLTPLFVASGQGLTEVVESLIQQPVSQLCVI